MKGKTTIMDTTGIILAGGKSSRFGFNKLKIRNNGVPLFIDQVFKLGFFCDEIIISASKKNQSFISSELNKISIYEKRYDFKKMQASNPEINFRFFFKRMAKAPGIKVILDEEIYNNTGISNISKTFGNRRPGKLCGGIGPILGIYLGLAGSSCHYSLVTASDMPFVSYNLLKLLSKAPTVSNEMQDSSKKDRLPFSVSGGKPAYIIKTGKGFETLCGLYSKYCLGTFKNNIIGQRYKI
ncbi:MAG: NTP transferase domain-containing protein, partial [Actinobacteria bacterium]|nr:NTP transferase domain-containing protein [Actinomycetota bacterium]